jgi:hypothetical protein
MVGTLSDRRETCTFRLVNKYAGCQVLERLGKDGMLAMRTHLSSSLLLLLLLQHALQV